LKGAKRVPLATQVLTQLGVVAKAPAEAISAVQSLPERQRELIDYYEQYETLVEVLCDAARFGPDIVLERRYTEVRARMQADYPPLRPFLISYLDFQPEDAEAGLKLCGRPLDAFETLVAAFDLQEFFKLDDGNMISRITRNREALNGYGEHLRQLAALAA
jgi:hypothetical protein